MIFVTFKQLFKIIVFFETGIPNNFNSPPRVNIKCRQFMSNGFVAIIRK